MKKDKLKKVAIIAGSGAAIYALYKISQGVEVAADAAKQLNPVNENNLINRGVSQVVSDTTGGQFDSLGSWLFCHNPFNNRNPAVCPNVKRQPATVEGIRARGTSGN